MSEQPSATARILIVDDHEGMTQLWKLMLEKTDRYIVKEENSSRQAVATAHAFRPNLVLLDMDMPHLDGSDVAAAMRADEVLRGVSIVFLTSMVTSREVAAGKLIEGYPCLAKPTSVDALVHVIESNLGRSKRKLRHPAGASTFPEGLRA